MVLAGGVGDAGRLVLAGNLVAALLLVLTDSMVAAAAVSDALFSIAKILSSIARILGIYSDVRSAVRVATAFGHA